MIMHKRLDRNLLYGIGFNHIPNMKIETMTDSLDFKLDSLGMRTAYMFSPCSEFGVMDEGVSRARRPLNDYEMCPTNALFARGKFVDCGGIAGTVTFGRTIHSVLDV